jgi:hypothetical protein
MMKMLSTGFVLAGVVCTPAPISHVQTTRTAPPDFRDDPRLVALRQFFAKAACPALTYSHDFLEAADLYKLDWRLLPSISYVESTGGKFARNNNFFGWDSGKASFDSPVQAIHHVGYRLSHSARYRSKNLDTLLASYNPDAEYGAKVKSIMRRIAPLE